MLLGRVVVDQFLGPLCDAGELASDPEFAFSYSVRRHASPQYTPPSVCLSHARQKSGDQFMLLDIVWGSGAEERAELNFIEVEGAKE